MAEFLPDGEVPIGEQRRLLTHPAIRIVALLSLTVLATITGVLFFGKGPVDVGPLKTEMAFTPTIQGGTTVNLGPLGAISFKSHVGLIRVDVDVRSMSPSHIGTLVNSPALRSFPEDAAQDLRDGLAITALRAAVGGLLVSLVLGTLVYRRRKPVLLMGVFSLVLSVIAGGSAYLTYNPRAVLEPRYQGLVAAVPSLVGDAQDIADNFGKYRDQLTKLLGNVSELYETGLKLPSYQTTAGSVSILHVSDLHLNPEGWDVIKLLVQQFKVDIIVDSGDISDHGSAIEDPYLATITELGVPYIYVRGNHDSAHTQEVIGRMQNAYVLDEGKIIRIGGLDFSGVGDPRFTPDKTQKAVSDARVVAAVQDLADEIVGKGVEVAVVHDSLATEPLEGVVPLVLSGHLHHRNASKSSTGTIFLQGGSTGGGGLRALTGKKPAPLDATLVHLDGKTGSLLAWDEISMGGVGLATVQLTRRLPENLSVRHAPGAAADKAIPVQTK